MSSDESFTDLVMNETEGSVGPIKIPENPENPIDLSKLIGGFLGSAAALLVTGILQGTESILALVVVPVEAAAGWLEGFMKTVEDVFTGFFDAAAGATAAEIVANYGLLGFVVAIVVVLAGLYIARLAVRELFGGVL